MKFITNNNLNGGLFGIEGGFICTFQLLITCILLYLFLKQRPIDPEIMKARLVRSTNGSSLDRGQDFEPELDSILEPDSDQKKTFDSDETLDLKPYSLVKKGAVVNTDDSTETQSGTNLESSTDDFVDADQDLEE
jgi:hypothetical protein